MTKSSKYFREKQKKTAHTFEQTEFHTEKNYFLKYFLLILECIIETRAGYIPTMSTTEFFYGRGERQIFFQCSNVPFLQIWVLLSVGI